MNPSRPMIRYHGGKWMLSEWIISHFPAHKIYTETFGGGASVLLRKSRSYAEVLNDLDGEIVNLFRVARDRGDELLEKLRLTPFAREEFVQSYDACSCPLEQARRTVVRSFMGFGSNSHNRSTGFRACSNRSGTTPAHDWKNYPDAMPALIRRLQGVIIENRDAIEIMAAHDSPETLHYVDPPYLPETRDKGGDYRYEMSRSEHVELSEFLRYLEGAVVLSGYESDLYSELYAGWHVIKRKAYADGASARIEALWIKGDLNQMRLAI